MFADALGRGRMNVAATPADDATSSAFDEAYRAHRDAVLRYLRTRSRNLDDALDLTSATFERALQAHRRGDPGCLSLPWLITTARNAAIDLGRRQRVRDAFIRIGLAEPNHPSPEVAVLIAEDRNQVIDAVRALPAAARDAVALRYGLGWSTREIAATLGRSEPATQKLIERALAKLRETVDG